MNAKFFLLSLLVLTSAVCLTAQEKDGDVFRIRLSDAGIRLDKTKLTKAELAKKMGQHQDAKVFIEATEETKVSLVMEVLDVLQKAGVAGRKVGDS